MDISQMFEDAFDPNNTIHVKWLKDFTACREHVMRHNPFGIDIGQDDTEKYMDVFVRLARKFIKSSVHHNFDNLFSYEYAYHMDGEYQKVRLLRNLRGFPKGTYFEYALVTRASIDFYNTDDDMNPTLSLSRF